jgi:hypothetical protein
MNMRANRILLLLDIAKELTQARDWDEEHENQPE